MGQKLGDWNELNEMVNRGDIDMMLSPMSATYDPRWNVTFAPYIVTGYDEAKDVFGPGGFMDEMFRSWAKEVNMHWLGTWIQGFAGVQPQCKSRNHSCRSERELKSEPRPSQLLSVIGKNLASLPA